MPPARTGVADYTAALVEALRPLASVEVNPDRPTGVTLCHVGNNPLHAEAYRRAVERPGAVILHDAVLHHFLLGWLDESAYVEEFVFNYGEWNRELAGELWRGRARSAGDAAFFQHGMLRRLAETARVVIVHNIAAEEKVRSEAPCARIEVVPHLALPPAEPPAGFEVLRVRERFGPGALVFGLFGHLRESKRVMTVLSVFRRVRRRHANAWLVVAGGFVSPDLERAAAPLLSETGVVRLPYLDERDFWLWAHAVDVCVNLRYPAAGETSGITVRMMGIGRAVMVTAGGETAEFPSGSCLPVDPGLAEEEMVEAFMEWLCHEPDRARELGFHARNHILRAHDPAAVARKIAGICARLA